MDATTADGKAPAAKQNDAQRAEDQPRKPRSAASGQHSQPQHRATVPSRSALHRSTRDGSKRQAMHRINGPGADGQPVAKQSWRRAPGQFREDAPGPTPAVLVIEVRPGSVCFPGSARP